MRMSRSKLMRGTHPAAEKYSLLPPSRTTRQLWNIFFDLANQTVQGISDTTSLTFSLSFQPMRQLVIPCRSANRGHPLGLGPENGNLTNVLLTVQLAEEAGVKRI